MDGDVTQAETLRFNDGRDLEIFREQGHGVQYLTQHVSGSPIAPI